MEKVVGEFLVDISLIFLNRMLGVIRKGMLMVGNRFIWDNKLRK
jgi:hypothetical protein